jgi:hypothetical protein
MASEMVKVLVLVDDLDAALAFVDALGAGPVVQISPTAAQTAQGLGWPEDHEGTRGAFVGTGPGLLEIVEIPPSLRGIVVPGVGKVTFSTEDPEGVAHDLRGSGFPVRGPSSFFEPGGGSYSTVRAALGGIVFEAVHHPT